MENLVGEEQLTEQKPGKVNLLKSKLCQILKHTNQISIELNEEIAQGTYSNLAVITHSASEFVIDFCKDYARYPESSGASRGLFLHPSMQRDWLLH